LRAFDAADGTPPPEPPAPGVEAPSAAYTVLCRIDAYADYTAIVEADSAEEAAELASDNHGGYHWVFSGTHEFDDRRYVTLDQSGDEIESTLVGDF